MIQSDTPDNKHYLFMEHALTSQSFSKLRTSRHPVFPEAATSVANTAAKPGNWATFDPVLTHKNYEKQVRRSLAK